MLRGLLCLLTLFPLAAFADTIVATRTIRAKEIISPADVISKQVDVAGAISNLSDAIGSEARVALYAGRPIRPGDIGPPAIVDRNDFVTLIYSHGTLRIQTDGRALGRGAPGEIVRVMNLSSHKTLSGLILEDGTIEVK